MRSPDLTDVERIEGLLRGIPPESEREAQLAGLIRELRGLNADAPAAVRERVRALDEPVRRSWGWKPALVLVPVILALGLVAAVAVGDRDGQQQAQKLEGASRERGRVFGPEHDAASTLPTFGLATRVPAPTSAPLTGAFAPAVGASGTRAQEWDVSMDLRVRDNDRLAAASQEAIRTTRELGGYVVSSSIGTQGTSGEARLTVRVPARRIQDAITRFGDLGTITAQNVDVQDRQGQLDAQARRIDSLRVQIAEVNLKLAQPGLSAPERLRLELRRERLRGLLNQVSSQRRALNDQVLLADLALMLRTGKSSATPSEDRVGGAARDAVHVLAVAGAVAVFLLIVLAPPALVAVAIWVAFRARRRRTEERLLDKPRPA
jgi:hypothetical protein